MLSQEDIISVLKRIPDPELGVSIYDLGLIYNIEIKPEGEVLILMTLTTMGCPLFSLIAEPIKQGVGNLDGVKKVDVELTFDPAWTVDKMSTEAKVTMGML